MCYYLVCLIFIDLGLGVLGEPFDRRVYEQALQWGARLLLVFDRYSIRLCVLPCPYIVDLLDLI
jgi:hypothetical protein